MDPFYKDTEHNHPSWAKNIQNTNFAMRILENEEVDKIIDHQNVQNKFQFENGGDLGFSDFGHIESNKMSNTVYQNASKNDNLETNFNSYEQQDSEDRVLNMIIKAQQKSLKKLNKLQNSEEYINSTGTQSNNRTKTIEYHREINRRIAIISNYIEKMKKESYEKKE
jgi:hypothetical protein